MFLSCHPPHGSEPVLQRKAGSVEDSPSCDRCLVSTPTAHQETSCGCPTAAGRALRATEPSWPSQPSQVGAAGTFCGEALLELGEGAHYIVLHGVTPLRLG